MRMGKKRASSTAMNFLCHIFFIAPGIFTFRIQANITSLFII